MLKGIVGRVGERITQRLEEAGFAALDDGEIKSEAPVSYTELKTVLDDLMRGKREFDAEMVEIFRYYRERGLLTVLYWQDMLVLGNIVKANNINTVEESLADALLKRLTRENRIEGDLGQKRIKLAAIVEQLNESGFAAAQEYEAFDVERLPVPQSRVAEEMLRVFNDLNRGDIVSIGNARTSLGETWKTYTVTDLSLGPCGIVLNITLSDGTDNTRTISREVLLSLAGSEITTFENVSLEREREQDELARDDAYAKEHPIRAYLQGL